MSDNQETSRETRADDAGSVPGLVGCRRCQAAMRRGDSLEGVEHRTIHIFRRKNVLSLCFTDGAAIGIRKDNPVLAEAVGEWFLDEIGELPDTANDQGQAPADATPNTVE